jgi:hypothetical protein
LPGWKRAKSGASKALQLGIVISQQRFDEQMGPTLRMFDLRLMAS